MLLPWKCVVPIWYSLMYHPLSSGGNPRFGGLKEHQQLAFEAGEGWFPGDFPGTRAGWEWTQRETEKSRRRWDRRPKGRRAEFDTLVLGDGRPKGEIGHGWACDWERLVKGPSNEDAVHNTVKKTDEQETDPIDPPSNIHTIRYTPGDTNKILDTLSKTNTDSFSLATIHLTLSNRGTPTPCARIYRLPTDPVLRRKWLALASTNRKSGANLTSPNDPALSDEEARRRLAESLISTSAHENSTADHLEVPMEEDLIGFVSTGNYNLSEGKGTGIGSIQLSKVLVPGAKPSERRMCIVRSAGEKLGRLGMWELV